jgi:hypothetical protein
MKRFLNRVVRDRDVSMRVWEIMVVVAMEIAMLFYIASATRQ